ncbi:MAG: hypothetical protein AB1810_14650 [Pseudomonadota bacterium]
MAKKRKSFGLDEPLLHRDHKRPVTRRDFLAQGLIGGLGITVAPSLFSLFANPRAAQAALSGDLEDLAKNMCGLRGALAAKIPFICIDLAGGANIVGSNVLAGKAGGPLDFLNTAGYSKMGLPGDMLPSMTDPTDNLSFTDTTLGLPFHKDSAFLRGIKQRINITTTAANVNGAVIPARSENDTGNNPHNPMYGIARYATNNYALGFGKLVTLIGSSSSMSGGNSLAPATMINPEIRPTKVDRPTDVTGLVDTGKMVGTFSKQQATSIMESVARLSEKKLDHSDTLLGNVADDAAKQRVKCEYVKSATIVDEYGQPSDLDPSKDPDIVGQSGIFTQAEFDGDGEFRKTASVMKMVINGYAGAGTISMGGYDYHTGDRSTGERRDLRAGQCMGACLEYAARKGVPLMLYVFSDGSLTSNGTLDNSPDGRGKGVWTGDNSDVAASFFLIYNPGGRPTPLKQQIGSFRPDGSVDTASSPAANNVNLLVETVILNYMALHGQQGQFATMFPGMGLSNASSALIDRLLAFEPIA